MKQPILIKLFFILWLILFGTVEIVQEIEFNRLKSTEAGSVTGMTQDIEGNTWFSTKQGLFKYYGNQISNYQNSPFSANSVNSNNLEFVFYDKDGSIWTGILGKGLDRSLSYDMVKAHGGELKVETEINEGTQMKMMLPLNS
jgi:ligand-binding sensor domain-containing protein